MTRYRPFINSDSPQVVAVWTKQPPLRGRFSRPTPLLLEQHLFSKPYFDPHGFIVAVDEDRVVGFVHAGFSPGTRPGEFDNRRGLICMLMVESRPDGAVIAAELLRLAEIYLRQKGAVELLGGSVGLCSPFYLGLYGGSNLPGVLAGDHTMNKALRANGYVEVRVQPILGRGLTDFRPPVDRQFMQLRRQFKLIPAAEPDLTCWQECCVRSWIQWIQFTVVPLGNSQPIMTINFWDVEPLSSDWGLRSVGLLDIRFPGPPRGDIMGCFMGETLRYFQEQGIGFVELQIADQETLLTDTARRLGFHEVDRGTQFRKTVEG